jgi:hypothetical protein
MVYPNSESTGSGFAQGLQQAPGKKSFTSTWMKMLLNYSFTNFTQFSLKLRLCIDGVKILEVLNGYPSVCWSVRDFFHSDKCQGKPFHLPVACVYLWFDMTNLLCVLFPSKGLFHYLNSVGFARQGSKDMEIEGLQI